MLFHFEATFCSPDSAGPTAPYSSPGAKRWSTILVENLVDHTGRSDLLSVQQYMPCIDKLWPSLFFL